MSLSDKQRRLLLLPTPVVAAAAIVALTASAAMADTAAMEWTNTKTPDMGARYSLSDVEALAEDDVWSVGGTFSGDRSAALHWDGGEWTETATPKGSWFSDVSAVESGEVWAVGSAGDGKSTHTSQWDGTAWQEVPTPQPEIPEDHTVGLRSIDGVATDDVWAVGNSSGMDFDTVPFIQHWNGTDWSLVDVPKLPDGAVGAGLTAVRARAADDVWAVGGTFAADETLTPLLLHWDGTEWSVNKLPFDDAGVYDIDFTADGRIWLSGSTYRDGNTFEGVPMLVVGDGENWNKLDVPATETALMSVEPDGTGGVVAVGYGDKSALVVRSDGETVTKETAPAVDPNADSSSLESVSLVPGTTKLWAVGFVNKFEYPIAAHTT